MNSHRKYSVLSRQAKQQFINNTVADENKKIDAQHTEELLKNKQRNTLQSKLINTKSF